jgi:hypothetical protein
MKLTDGAKIHKRNRTKGPRLLEIGGGSAFVTTAAAAGFSLPYIPDEVEDDKT